MRLPGFLASFTRKPSPPTITSAARTLAMRRHNHERNRIIDRANLMAAEMGLPLIARRPE